MSGYRLYCAAVLTLAGCRSAEPLPPAVAQRPNVVLITLDTTRADRLGSYGYEGARTDTLDGLARAGRRYEHAYSVLPLTIPAHASLFTALYPPHHTIRSNGVGVLRPEFITLAEVLAGQGWRTAASVAAFVTTPVWGFDQGFDVFMSEGIGGSSNLWHSERPAAAVVDDALRWKDSQSSTDPLFLWVHLFDAHLPYQAPEPYAAALPGRPYDAELAYVDDQVARLVEAFGTDDTIFVIVGDHGEGFGEHGESRHGLYTYNSTQHVPYIVSGAGVEPGVVSTPTSLVDVAPTLLDMLDLPPLENVDGAVVPGTSRPLYMESWQLAEHFGLAPHQTLVDGDYVFIEQPKPELYNVHVDPSQRHNLAGDDPARVLEMRHALTALAMPQPSQTVGVSDPELALQLEQLGYVQGTVSPMVLSDLPDAKDHQTLLDGMRRVPQLSDSEDYAGALGILTELIERYPGLIDLQLRRYRTLRQMEDTAGAVAQLHDIREQFAESVAGRHAQAASQMSTGEFRAASILYAELAAEMPYNPGFRSRAVWALMQVDGSPEEALALGLTTLERHPEDVGVSALVGLMLMHRGDPEAAAPYLDRGCDADRPLRSVCQHVGVRAQLAGDAERARTRLDRELRFHPTNDAALRAIQVLLSDEKNWVLLIVAVERLLLLRGESAALRQAQAQALFNLEDFEASRQAVDRGLALHPEWSALLLLDANLLAKEGEMERAQARFEQATAALASESAEDASP
ncbi:MAG: choline-sulfatase [Myxococcota bacterium]